MRGFFIYAHLRVRRLRLPLKNGVFHEPHNESGVGSDAITTPASPVSLGKSLRALLPLDSIVP